MAEFIQPLVEKALAIITAKTPELLGELPPFATAGRLFTGVVENFPGVWVMPVRTSIGDDGTGKIDEVHALTLKLALSASNPEELPGLAMAYVRACGRALEGTPIAEWNEALPDGGVLHVHVAEHNYGIAWNSGRGFAMLPEMYVEIEAAELEEAQ